MQVTTTTVMLRALLSYVINPAAGALESRARIDGTDIGPNYSEQQMIDCVTRAAGFKSNGCDGGQAGQLDARSKMSVNCAAMKS